MVEAVCSACGTLIGALVPAGSSTRIGIGSTLLIRTLLSVARLETVFPTPPAGELGPARPSAPHAALPERGHARSLLTDDAGVVEVGRAGRLATHQHRRARPHRHARAAAATLLIAHDVAPFGAVDVAVSVG